jgi:hypothetical protein
MLVSSESWPHGSIYAGIMAVSIGFDASVEGIGARREADCTDYSRAGNTLAQQHHSAAQRHELFDCVVSRLFRQGIRFFNMWARSFALN